MINVLRVCSRDNSPSISNIKEFSQEWNPPLLIQRWGGVHYFLSNAGGQGSSVNIAVIGKPGQSSAHKSSSIILDKTSQVPHTALGAGPQGLQEPHHAAAQHGFGVTATRDSFDQIAMSSPRNVKDIPDSDIPRGEDLGDLTGVQVPETATIEGCDIDSKELHNYRRVNIVELLQ